MLQTRLLCQAISSKSLRELIGDIANQLEQLVDSPERFRYRDRITQVAESDLYRARKRTWLGLLACQSPHMRSALKKRLD
jgi:hypothetical protein